MPKLSFESSPNADLTAVSASVNVSDCSTTSALTKVVMGLTTVDPGCALRVIVLARPVSILIPPVATIGPGALEAIVKTPFASVFAKGSPLSRTPFLFTSIKAIASLTSPSCTTADWSVKLAMGAATVCTLPAASVCVAETLIVPCPREATSASVITTACAVPLPITFFVIVLEPPAFANVTVTVAPLSPATVTAPAAAPLTTARVGATGGTVSSGADEPPPPLAAKPTRAAPAKTNAPVDTPPSLAT